MNPTSTIFKNPLVRQLIDLALLEDIGIGDITSELTLPMEATARGVLIAKEAGVLAGIDVAGAVFRQVDEATTFTARRRDGERFEAGNELGVVEGSARSVMTAERTALNFLQQLCGIATLTARYVEEVAGTNAKVIDTRKTIPGWRALSKYAVRMGGGHNHRLSLADAVLIKDNHIAVAGSVTRAMESAKRGAPHTMGIEIEVDTLEQFDEALAAGATIVLLDNMPPDTLREAVRRNKGRATLEASGGIRLETLRAVAETGVDVISTRAITSDARTIDISLDVTIKT
ncbi:MAG: carboxylating nicotinate-nucleotide diphosphorylase [Candidatus Poribacteria bacterium]|nr:carboxylating nicotinate-nucleotide diphosphorylase [Candidatus Poribacteria bacterium]